MVTQLTITSFPYAILPNKLLQELRALATGAGLDIPLVDELAADIFRGRFSGKFIESAKRAADLLDGSLYVAYLIMIKNTAYAWRQMVFFLALLSKQDAADLLCQAREHLDAQPVAFVTRFRPALQGLILAADGRSIDGNSGLQSEARRFLGWSKDRHWLLDGERST